MSQVFQQGLSKVKHTLYSLYDYGPIVFAIVLIIASKISRYTGISIVIWSGIDWITNGHTCLLKQHCLLPVCF